MSRSLVRSPGGSIDDLDVIRSGGMKKVIGGVYASATLGIVQLSTVLRRHLVALAERTPVLDGISDRAFIDIDSLLRPVYGRGKQAASFGHTKIAGKAILRRGLSPLAVSICTETAAPVLAGVRLRAGRAGSGKGAASMVTEALNTAIAAGAQVDNILVRGDSAYCRARWSPRSSTPERRSPLPSPAIPRSTPRSAASPTMRARPCATPARSSIPTPGN
jgi:hypothetical protein